MRTEARAIGPWPCLPQLSLSSASHSFQGSEYSRAPWSEELQEVPARDEKCLDVDLLFQPWECVPRSSHPCSAPSH